MMAFSAMQDKIISLSFKRKVRPDGEAQPQEGSLPIGRGLIDESSAKVSVQASGPDNKDPYP